MAVPLKSKPGRIVRGKRANKTDNPSLKKPEPGKIFMQTQKTTSAKSKTKNVKQEPIASGQADLQTLEAENARLRELLEKESRERKSLEDILQRNEFISNELAETALRQAQELALLDRVRFTIASKLDMPTLLSSVVKSIVDVYGYTHVSVYMLEGDKLVLQHQVGYKQVIEYIGLYEGISGKVARTGSPVLVENVREHPEFLGAADDIQSEITVPLMDNDRVAGTLSIESTNRLTEADLKIMIALSVDVGAAIGRARLYEDVQRRNSTLSALQESTLAIMGHLDLPEALQAILAQAAQLIGTTHGYIYLVQADGTLKLMTGLGVYPRYTGLIIEMGEGLGGTVWKNASPLIINDYEHWEGRSQKFAETPFCAVMGVPLLNGDRVAGVLGLSYLESDKIFDDEDVELLSRFAQLASIAIENAALYTQMHQELLERKEADKKLRASEERLAAVMEGSQLGYSDWNIQTGEVKRNERWAKMLGYTLEEVEENLAQWVELLHPDDHEKALQSIKDHIDGKTLVHRDEYRLRAKDGQYRWILDQGRIIEYDAQGRPLRLTATHTDITEQKKAEQALRESEENYRNLVEHTPVIVYLDHADEMGTNFYISPQIERILGYSTAVFKENPTIWHTMIHPEDYELATESIKNAIRNHESVEEYRIIALDGRVLWVRDTSVVIVDETGKPKFIQGFLEDITERKQAEESLGKSERRLQAFFNQSLDGFFFCDFEEPIEWKHSLNKDEMLEYIISSKRFTEVNDAMLKQYGVDRENFLRLTTKDIFAHDMEQGRRLRRELFDKGHLHIETYERTSEGTPVWFEGDYVCLYDSNERITGFFGIQRNITDRKNAEDALRNSEKQYRTLFTGMLDGVYRSTHDGKFVDVNPAMVKMFGYSSREEMLKIDIKKDLYFSLEERNSLFLDTGQEKVDEFRMKRKDGSEIWVEDHGRYVHDEDGNVIYHEGILRDITERKKAEDALKRSEAFTKSIVENEPECVKIVGAGGILQYMNPAGLAMIEAESLEPLVGKSVYPIIAEKDRQAFIELNEKVLRGEQGTLRFEIVGLKGTRRWLDTNAVPLYDENGSVTALLGLTRDITERMRAAEAVREAEEKYHAIFENSVEGIYQSSPNGHFYTLNPAFASMMGYDSPQEMMLSITDIARQLYVETKRREDFIQQLEEQDSVSGFEYQMRRKDGRLIWVSENARLVRNADGSVSYYEGFLEDITARKQNEQRIDNHLRQLNALHSIDNAINSNFDLRTMLDVILREVVAQLRADATCVLLFNKETHTLDYTAGRGFFSKATQHTKLSVGEGYAGRVILDRRMVHIPDMTKAENNRLTDALNLAGENFVAYVGTPLIAKGQVVGVLEIFQRSPHTPDPAWFDFLTMIADQAAIAIDNAQLFENLQRSNFDLTLAYDATIEGWSRALDLRDRETEGHTQRVTNLTVKLARRMGIPDSDILHIRRGALLHDIGKMGIPDNILHKPDKLTPEEWDIMHQHTNYAYQMLTPIKYLKPALDIPRHHHEKWDGTGYPEGLKGEQIPIAARIFAVVDVWDALTSDRSYRDAWSREKVIEYIRSESGKHFDPKVVEMFLTFILNETP